MPPPSRRGGHIVFVLSFLLSFCLSFCVSTGLFGEQIRMAIRSHPHPIILRELNSCGRKKKREDTWGYESLPYRYARRTKPTELGQPIVAIVAQRVTLDLTIITQSQFPFLPGTSHALKKRWRYMRRPDLSVYHQTPQRKLYEDQKFWADEYIKVFSPLNSRCQVLTCVLLACRQIVSLHSNHSMLKLYRSTVQVNIFSSHTDTDKNIHK